MKPLQSVLATMQMERYIQEADMTQTVCDICGKPDRSMHHCIVPMYRKYNIVAQGIKLNEYQRVEATAVDLCEEHFIMLADFIRLVEENTDVH